MKYIKSIYPLLTAALMLSLFAVQSCVDQPGSQEEELNKLKALQSEEAGFPNQAEEVEEPAPARDKLEIDKAEIQQQVAKKRRDSIKKAALKQEEEEEKRQLQAVLDSIADLNAQANLLQAEKDSLEKAEQDFLNAMATKKDTKSREIESLDRKIRQLEQEAADLSGKDTTSRAAQKSEKIKKDSTIEDSVVYVANPDLQAKDSLQKSLTKSFPEDQKKLEELNLEISKKKEQIEAIKRELSSNLDKLSSEQEKVVAKAKEKAAGKQGSSNTLLVVLLTTIIVVLILYLLGKDQSNKKKSKS